MFYIDPDRDAFMEIQNPYCEICSRVMTDEEIRHCEISDCPHRDTQASKSTQNNKIKCYEPQIFSRK